MMNWPAVQLAALAKYRMDGSPLAAAFWKYFRSEENLIKAITVESLARIDYGVARVKSVDVLIEPAEAAAYRAAYFDAVEKTAARAMEAEAARGAYLDLRVE